MAPNSEPIVVQVAAAANADPVVGGVLGESGGSGGRDRINGNGIAFDPQLFNKNIIASDSIVAWHYTVTPHEQPRFHKKNAFYHDYFIEEHTYVALATFFGGGRPPERSVPSARPTRNA